MRRVYGFGPFLLAVALAGCGSTLHDAFHPSFISGEDAREVLDREAGAMLAARHPHLTVGSARCPYLMNITGKRVGECTISVGGKTLRIGVASDNVIRAFIFPSDIDALVVRRDAEPQLADDLTREYGVPFAVHCDGPPVRVLPVKEHFTCAIDAAGIDAKRLDVYAGDRDGRLHAEPLKHTTLLAHMLGGVHTGHADGGIVFAGPLVERYLHETAGESLHGELVRRGLLGAARCPPRIVLSERTSAMCTVHAGTSAVSYDLSFRPHRGLVITPMKHFVVLSGLQGLAQRYLEHRVWPVAVTGVTCGHDRVVAVDDEDVLRCRGTYGRRTHVLSAEFGGEDGYEVTFQE